MAVDIVPQLNERIGISYTKYSMRDRELIRISSRIRDGTATLKDGHEYAKRVGEHLSEALLENMTEDALPDGRLYYNIAVRTVLPHLQENYELVNEINAAIQTEIDKAQNIGIKPVKADFPKERIDCLIDKITADDNTLEDARKWLGEPIVNNTEAFHDDFIRKNAEFRESVGLKAVIIREASSKCCDWCAKLEGVYDYASAPKEVYARHEYCRCDVTYQTERKSQNVWSKASWASSQDEINKRINYGTEE